MTRNTVLGLSLFLTAAAMVILGFLPGKKAPLKAKADRPAALAADTRQFFDAVRAGNLPAVRAGLESGVDINAQNEFGEAALHLVRDPRLALFLLEHGADVHLREREFGMTPLFFQERPIADMLVKAGADVNARSDKGNTPFLWYTYSGYQEGLNLLISSGADVQASNADGQTALDIADVFGSPELVEFLEAAGVVRGTLGPGETERL